MFKDKTVTERTALIKSQYAAALEQLNKASEMKKNAKKALMILQNQLEVLQGLETPSDDK